MNEGIESIQRGCGPHAQEAITDARWKGRVASDNQISLTFALPLRNTGDCSCCSAGCTIEPIRCMASIFAQEFVR